LSTEIEKGQARARGISEGFVTGHIAPSVWQAAVMEELKAGYLQHAALAAGGWDRLTQSDYGYIGGRLAAEYRHVARFIEQALEAKLTPDQISARLAQYLGGSRAAFYHIETLHLPPDAPGTMTLERREPEKGEVCEECKALAARGWQPAGVLPPPTSESRCRGHCKCRIERITVPLDRLAQYLGHPA
jgi:hypothetical protein